MVILPVVSHLFGPHFDLLKKKSTFRPHCSTWKLKDLQAIASTQVMSCHTISKPLFFIQIENTLSPSTPSTKPSCYPIYLLPYRFQIPFDTVGGGSGAGKGGGVYSRFLHGLLCVSLINYIYTDWSPRGAEIGFRDFVVIIGLS
jgi:hypothetical protein